MYSTRINLALFSKGVTLIELTIILAVISAGAGGLTALGVPSIDKTIYTGSQATAVRDGHIGSLNEWYTQDSIELNPGEPSSSVPIDRGYLSACTPYVQSIWQSVTAPSTPPLAEEEAVIVCSEVLSNLLIEELRVCPEDQTLENQAACTVQHIKAGFTVFDTDSARNRTPNYILNETAPCDVSYHTQCLDTLPPAVPITPP